MIAFVALSRVGRCEEANARERVSAARWRVSSVAAELASDHAQSMRFGR
jgi:hypothetical protein